jgi:chorismate dehydratase
VNAANQIFRIGSVSYLNAKPLIHGLDRHPGIEMVLDVPARLLDGLRSGRCDVALLPVIDYQKLPGLRVIPSGGIGCDGPTLTVRIFSNIPIAQIQSLACDVESHTSVALAQIILKQRWNARPKIVDLNGKIPSDGAVLLIGDKVITAPPKMEHQLDLGEAWKELTGMPFVFAVWTARQGVELGDLPKRLEEAKESGLANLEQIVADHAESRGWPTDLALRYLADHLKYDVGPLQLAAIELFHRLAHENGLISPPRPIVLA